LKIEFVTRFHHSSYNQAKERLFYVQDCVKKTLVTANIYYINIAKKKIFIL